MRRRAVRRPGNSGAVPSATFSSWGRGLHWKGPAPRQAWQRDLGEGYAAIVGDARTIYATFRHAGAMQVAALDAATGRPRWEQSIDDPLLPNMFLDYGRGPNSTPLLGRWAAVRGDPSPGGSVRSTPRLGRTLWTRELWADLKGTFRDVGGHSNSPLAFRDLLILPVGGKGRGSGRRFDSATDFDRLDERRSRECDVLADPDSRQPARSSLRGAHGRRRGRLRSGDRHAAPGPSAQDELRRERGDARSGMLRRAH